MVQSGEPGARETCERVTREWYRVVLEDVGDPMIATAGKVTVAEVEEIVPTGTLDPDQIHTPGVFVQRLLQGAYEKRIEQRTVRKRAAEGVDA